MALFSIGHDCSHASFSIYPVLNDAMGQLLTFVFVCCDSIIVLFRYPSFHMDNDSILSMEGTLPLTCCHSSYQWFFSRSLIKVITKILITWTRTKRFFQNVAKNATNIGRARWSFGYLVSHGSIISYVEIHHMVLIISIR